MNLITEGLTKMQLEIDVAELAEQLKAGKGISGKDGALTPLIKKGSVANWCLSKNKL